MLLPPHPLKNAVALVIRAGLLAESLAPAALAKIGPFSMANISEALVRAYNREDAAALHGLVAPSLRAKHTVEAVRERD